MKERSQESDWRLYRERVSGWRERYLEKANRGVGAVLSDDSKTPTERFWDAHRRMEEVSRVLADCFDGHARSRMQGNLLIMHGNGVIFDDDLSEFSDGLRERIESAARELFRED